MTFRPLVIESRDLSYPVEIDSVSAGIRIHMVYLDPESRRA